MCESNRSSESRQSEPADSHNNLLQASEIFRDYGDEIYAMIRMGLRNENEADDIFQDLFLSITYRPVPSHIKDIKAYLYRAVMHDIVDHARRTKSHKNRIQQYANQRRYRMSSQQDPADMLMQAEELDRMFDAIEQRLPPSEAGAVVHQYGLEHDTTEAADEMGIKKRSFARYVCMGLKKIRNVMREQG
jgi:RNA polymerase sigma factor (sigma-70 family)